MSLFLDENPYTVLVGDSKIADEDVVLEWCQRSEGFVGVTKTDVSDVSYTDDYIYAYMFETKEAANWFRLRWL